MKDDYKFSGPTSKLTADIEKNIYDVIVAMSEYTQIPISELTNTALKRFVSAHKDFLPPRMPAQKAAAPAKKAS